MLVRCSINKPQIIKSKLINNPPRYSRRSQGAVRPLSHPLAVILGRTILLKDNFFLSRQCLPRACTKRLDFIVLRGELWPGTCFLAPILVSEIRVARLHWGACCSWEWRCDDAYENVTVMVFIKKAPWCCLWNWHCDVVYKNVTALLFVRVAPGCL